MAIATLNFEREAIVREQPASISFNYIRFRMRYTYCPEP
jgi:hypothetical protein